MRNTQKPFRLVIFNALNGHITYGGNPVHFFDERKTASEQADIYVTFGSQSERVIEENDSCFITQSTIKLAVVAKSFSEISKDIINDISDSILLLLLPNTQTNGFTDPSGMQIQNIKLLDSETGIIFQSTNFTLTQTITLTAQIVQQS